MIKSTLSEHDLENFFIGSSKQEKVHPRPYQNEKYVVTKFNTS